MKLLLLTLLCAAYAIAVEIPEREKRAPYWRAMGERDVMNAVGLFENNIKKTKAKNVVMMIGDGMSLATSTASRVYMGQKQAGANGEEFVTEIEKLPHVGVLKNYNLNKQTPDSAGTATAFLTGVKTNAGMLGVTAKGNSCWRSQQAVNRLETILEKAAKMGKSTGIVTTTRVQHATPGAAYAKVPSRTWLDDKRVPYAGCKDIAQQLYEKRNDIQVILGGGTQHMEQRRDGRNLTKLWVDSFAKSNKSARYVTDRRQLLSVDADSTDHLMGLFAPGEMAFRLQNPRPVDQPTLSEMVEAAVKILSKNENGFFLLIESGLIDKAHHKNLVKYALEEYIQLDNSVRTVKSMTSEEDTLVVVTADHGHMFMFGGNSDRGTSVTGLSENPITPRKTSDRKYFTSVVYGNGPSYPEYMRSMAYYSKYNAEAMTKKDDFRPPSVFWLPGETHSAEDVLSYASGPMAHLFHGVHEQNFMAHVVMYAACMDGPADEQFETRPHCISEPPKLARTTKERRQ